MAKPKPSWTDKVNASKPPIVKPVPFDGMGMKMGQIMLIASPKLIDEFVRTIPKGIAIDIPTLRQRLAKAHGAEVSCPLTTGIFLRIVTEAANEAYASGTAVSKLAPVWRVLDPKAPLVKKLSFDPEWIWDQRVREGI